MHKTPPAATPSPEGATDGALLTPTPLHRGGNATGLTAPAILLLASRWHHNSVDHVNRAV